HSSSACNQSIAFDEIGRPYTLSTSPNSLRLITQTCKYTLIHQNKEKASICIEPETGYTRECE
ncbi:MAG: hypothetical protein LBQ52_08185, partial [Helicobacteraceae bacterium]|nr:hypothetical protein [Helicobacteraceae bacterium]